MLWADQCNPQLGHNANKIWCTFLKARIFARGAKPLLRCPDITAYDRAKRVWRETLSYAEIVFLLER